MKFLLTAVNAKYIHSNPAIYSLRAYAGAELQKHIELAEYTINNYTQDILADIYRRNPDVIGFSCYIWNWSLIQDLLRELPKVLPHTDIWLGGPEVTYDADFILKEYPQVSGIMIGEGEATFKELLESYVQEKMPDSQRAENKMVANETVKSELAVSKSVKIQVDTCKEDNTWAKRKWQQIAGLCLHTGYTPVRELTDISTLPFLYEHLEPFTNRIIYYETSRGCPYRCSYCLSSIDKKVRLRDIGVIKEELQFFLDKKVPQVKFVDRTFNCNHEHAMEIWEYIYEHDNGVTNFHFEISADILREDEIALLKKFRPGLAQLEIGVQSTKEETIHAINRVMNVQKLEHIVASIKKGNNIHQHLDLIAGLPYEDYESFGHSFNRVYEMEPEQLQLGFLKVLKGSEMHERAQEFGICYLSKPPYEVLYTKWMSYNDVLRLKHIEEMVEIYYNSNQYTHTLPFLLRAFASPFAMYEAMAAFYEKEGYFVKSPARAYRYQVLLKFAETYDGENFDVYKELLTYDMYLRENLKSRPNFATDLSENAIKGAIRAFYQKEETEREYLSDYMAYDWKQLSKMTHLEPFCYPVWNQEALVETIKKKKEVDNKSGFSGEKTDGADAIAYILFDYKSRNPLNYEATTQLIEM